MSLLNKIEGYCLNEIKQIGSTKPIDEKNKARVDYLFFDKIIFVIYL